MPTKRTVLPRPRGSSNAGASGPSEEFVHDLVVQWTLQCLARRPMRREQRLKRRAHLDGGDMDAFTDANEEAEDSEAGAAEVACKRWCSAEVMVTATGMVRCSEVETVALAG